ncbi:MAG TPA: hypothetical protein PKB02_07925 [Anaerohalosphaeraceae bacterium]|nr:hypothetical protein [Anaerohalosphaeraceae bacterium]
MKQITDKILRQIERDARLQVARLSKEILNAPSQQKEAIAAGMEIERWLADSCQECLPDRKC